MTHRTQVVGRPKKWGAYCSCGWKSQVFDEMTKARAEGRGHEFDATFEEPAPKTGR